jgi:predicted ATPase/DNA-binding SARP family transcriptional activator
MLLGPLEVWLDGQRVPLGGARAEKLLAALALEAGHTVPVERLVDVLWDDDPPATAPRQVRNIAASLRRLLTDGLVADGPGYRLDGVRIDAHVFVEHLERARAAGDRATAAKEIRAALGLCRGPALSGIGSRLLASAAVELDERRLGALEECVELELELGLHRELVGELSALVAAYPMRERFTAQLMLALYRCGRVGDALAAYRELRARLAAELGVDTSPELAGLESAILRVDPTLQTPALAAGWRGPRSHLTVLVGRERERAEVGELLRHARLVTLVGVGGVGKSSLALSVAEDSEHADGVVVVALASLCEADEVVLAIGSVLGISGTTTEEVARECERHLASRRLLLVLDSCEHVAAACADMVRRLLAQSPGLTVLTASRRPLGLAEEVVYALDGLAGDSAADLFRRRAEQARPGVELDAAQVARICVRLDGLPLALELAATRLRALPLRELADRLDQNLGLLSVGRGGADPRHATLTAAIEWSHRLLDPLEQRLLARLSVFRGGFTALEAEEVCGRPPLSRDRVLPTLAGLVDHSVVQPYPEEARYRLLAAVREFAAGRLESMGEAVEVAGCHLDYRLAQFRQLYREPTLQDIAIAGMAVWPEPGNLRAALEHGVTEGRPADVLELTSLVFLHWMVRRTHHVEGDRWLDAGWPHLDSCVPPVRRRARMCRAIIELDRCELLRTRELLRPIASDTDLDDPHIQGELLSMLTVAELRTLNPEALDTGADFLAKYRDLPDTEQVVLAAYSLAYALVTWGRYEEAARLCEEYAERADTVSAACAGRYFATRTRAEYGRGNFLRAREFAERAERSFASPANFAHPSVLYRALVYGALVDGDARDTAARALRSLRALYPPSMDRSAEFGVLLAEAHRRAGEHDAALALLAKGLRGGGQDYSAMMPGVLSAALLATDLGDHDVAHGLLFDWDRIRRALGLPVPQGFETVVANRYGVDLSLTSPTGPWTEEPLAELVDLAAAWCGVTP